MFVDVHACREGDPTVKAVAARHNRTAAAVALRWVVQQGVPVATSSGKESYDVYDLNSVDDDDLTLRQSISSEKGSIFRRATQAELVLAWRGSLRSLAREICSYRLHATFAARVG